MYDPAIFYLPHTSHHIICGEFLETTSYFFHPGSTTERPITTSRSSSTRFFYQWFSQVQMYVSRQIRRPLKHPSLLHLVGKVSSEVRIFDERWAQSWCEVLPDVVFLTSVLPATEKDQSTTDNSRCWPLGHYSLMLMLLRSWLTPATCQRAGSCPELTGKERGMELFGVSAVVAVCWLLFVKVIENKSSTLGSLVILSLESLESTVVSSPTSFLK